MKQLIACCGLDCENCTARIASVNNDDELREKTAKEWSVPIAAITVLSVNVCTKKVSIPAVTVRNWILARW